MSDLLEARLRGVLDRLTEHPPLPNAERPRPPHRRATRHLAPVVAVAAVVVVGLIGLRSLGRGDDPLRQETGPRPTSVDATPAPAPPAPPGPRTAYPDAPTVGEAPVARASAAFGYGRDGHWTWFVVDGTSGSVRVAAEVHAGGWRGIGGGALSPDGRRLAYSIPGDPTVRAAAQVVVVDLASAVESRFVANALLVPGAWAPDGRGLAWLDVDKGQLVLAAPDGRPLHAVTVGAGRENLAWSPDGARLVVAGCVGDPPACPPAIVDAAGLVARELPQPMTARTVWSPDGRDLVDLALRDAVLVAADGTGARPLGALGRLYAVGHPFSPDGTLVITRPDASGRGTLYAGVVGVADGRMRAQPSDEQQVPQVVGWKGNGALLVAREERELVFYEVGLDGSTRRRLFSVAIREEGFGASRVMIADWFSRTG